MTLLEWSSDPSGRICTDAVALQGTRNNLDFFEKNYFPGSTSLACKGDCDCELNPVVAVIVSDKSPDTPIAMGGAGVLLVLDGVVKSRRNQNPRARNPRGNRTPKGEPSVTSDLITKDKRPRRLGRR